MSIKLSPVIAGTMKWGVWGAKFSTEKYLRMIEECIARDVTTFDHADIYGDYTTEEEFGNALQQKPELRKQIQLITKCGIRRFTPNRPEHKISYYDTSKHHIITSVERSLKNLHTDYIDILLIHRPDPLMHPAEIAEAFEALKEQGKVLHFGVSNFAPAKMEALQSYLSFPLITNQIELSLFHHEDFFNGTVDTLMKHRMSPMAWSPLGGGKHFEDGQLKSQLENLSHHYQSTPTQLLLAWLLKHPSSVFPILGTTKTERIEEGAKSINLNLERQHWFDMLRWVTGKDVA